MLKGTVISWEGTSGTILSDDGGPLTEFDIGRCRWIEEGKSCRTFGVRRTDRMPDPGDEVYFVSEEQFGQASRWGFADDVRISAS